jgi:hypothetical protein
MRALKNFNPKVFEAATALRLTHSTNSRLRRTSAWQAGQAPPRYNYGRR